MTRRIGVALVAGSLMSVGLASAAPSPSPLSLLSSMVGTWKVEQWMWPAADAQPVTLPAATAQRQLIGDHFVQEIMNATDASQAFTRIAYFGYNDVTRRFEYFSIDTRAPQMMNERSVATPETAQQTASSAAVKMAGETFTAPQWGPGKNVSFHYRLELGPLEAGHQTAQLYLTPLSGSSRKEFLAFKYLYSRQN